MIVSGASMNVVVFMMYYGDCVGHIDVGWVIEFLQGQKERVL